MSGNRTTDIVFIFPAIKYGHFLFKALGESHSFMAVKRITNDYRCVTGRGSGRGGDSVSDLF